MGQGVVLLGILFVVTSKSIAGGGLARGLDLSWVHKYRASKLWKTLHPKHPQQRPPKGAPCCWELVLMFDTCTAGIPLSPTLFGLSAALHLRCTKSFCGVAFPHVWVTLEGMCHCAGLGTWVPIADTYCPVLLRITGSLVPKSYSQLCGYLGTWVLQRNLRGTGSLRRLYLQEAC